MFTREEADNKIASGIQFVQYFLGMLMVLSAIALVIAVYIFHPEKLIGFRMLSVMASLAVAISAFVFSLDIIVRRLKKDELEFRLASVMTIFISVIAIIAFSTIVSYI